MAVATDTVSVHKDVSTLRDNGPRSILNQAMLLLASQPKAIFVGQGVASDGVATYDDLDGVPMDQRIEFPVAEELQVGFGIGLSLQGFLPILVFPRCDFLLRAMDQIVNHLDKLERMSRGQFKPKVIIRTRVGGKTPLDAGPQHTQDLTLALRDMLQDTMVSKISKESDIMATYEQAIARNYSTIVVEALGC